MLRVSLKYSRWVCNSPLWQPGGKPGGSTIPIVVVTAKNLTTEDRLRLNGYVEKILQKGAYSREELLTEVRNLVATAVCQVTQVKG